MAGENDVLRVKEAEFDEQV